MESIEALAREENSLPPKLLFPSPLSAPTYSGIIYTTTIITIIMKIPQTTNMDPADTLSFKIWSKYRWTNSLTISGL